MSSSCVIRPKRGAKTFDKLKESLGREKAAVIFNNMNNSSFVSQYKDSLTFDSEGVPTFESIMSNSAVQSYLSKADILKAYNKNMPHYEDTLANAELLIKESQEFNKRKGNEAFTSFVEKDDKGNLTIKVELKGKTNSEIAETQRKIYELNKAIDSILAPVGITMQQLSKQNSFIGRIGITDFSKAKDFAHDFAGIMAVANNLSGFEVKSEEFSHFIIGVYKDMPLVKRSIDALMNESVAKEVLGDDFDDIYEIYNGNMAMVAEEAAGHILQQKLLNRESENIKKRPLFKRAIDAILNLFKRKSPAKYLNTLMYVENNLGKVAQDIAEGNIKLTRDKIAKAHREARFNALAEKAERQLEALRKSTNLFVKYGALEKELTQEYQEFGDYGKRVEEFISKLRSIVTKKARQGESMEAISLYLKSAVEDLRTLYHQLNNIEELTVRDKFTVLKNIMMNIACYDSVIKNIREVLTSEYIEDPELAEQEFLKNDAVTINDVLQSFEETNPQSTIDTSNMTPEEAVEAILNESAHFKLTPDEETYIDDRTNDLSARVTKAIHSDTGDITGEFDKSSPWFEPSTNIGTGIDELVRSFLGGKITKTKRGNYKINGRHVHEVFPNITKKAANQFLDELSRFKQEREAEGWTFVTRDVIASGTVETTDSSGKVHKVRIAGTLDLLAYNKDGEFAIWDIKSHVGAQIGTEKFRTYERQVTLYKDLLEQKFGIKVVKTAVLPIKVNYPSPAIDTNTYKVSEETKPTDYPGVKTNQLILNGTPFKGSAPKLEDVKPVNTRTLNMSYIKFTKDYTGGLGQSKKEIIDTLTAVEAARSDLRGLFNQIALPAFAEFAKTFIEKPIKVKNDKGALVEVDIARIFEEAPRDLSMLNRLFTTMSSSPDAALQVFNYIYKNKLRKAQDRSVVDFKEITGLGKEFEDRGVTNYEWMFEENKSHYIVHYTLPGGRVIDFSYVDYQKAKETFISNLNAKYGNNPLVGTEDSKNKEKELKEWIEEHTEKITIDGRNTRIPKNSYFPSRYNSLSNSQREFYDRWINLKIKYDNLIGRGGLEVFSTIKIRRKGMERAKKFFSSKALSNFTDSVRDTFMKSYDDTERGTNAIRGFNGEEILQLPKYYVNNPSGDDSMLSTDVIGTLVAYADMANRYDAMDDVISAMEVGKESVLESRKIAKTIRGKQAIESYSYKGKKYENPIYENTRTSEFAKALENFFNSKLYGRLVSDAGEIKGVDVNKTANWLLKLGSMAQLGFNTFAHTANALTGLALTNIEAAAGQFFKAKDLRKADARFMKELISYAGEIGQRQQNSWIANFDQFFNVKFMMTDQMRHMDFLNKTILTRIFGPHLQFFGQDAGDFWLYNRIALAVTNNIKVQYKGEIVSLTDCLELVDVDPNNKYKGKMMRIKEGTKVEDGSRDFTMEDKNKVSLRIGEICKILYGVYNEEDTIEARQYVWGRFLLQYRDWMVPAFRHRFAAKSHNIALGEDMEGFYRTTGGFLWGLTKDLYNGRLAIKESWNSLEDYEKANCRRALTELVQWGAVWLLAAALRGDDGEDRTWFRRYLSYMATREKTELGVLTPFGAIPEGIKILKSPAANTSIISDTYNLTIVAWPGSWFDEIERGEYAGHSSAYRALLRSPLSLWYRTIKRTFNPEKAQQYYE